MAELVFNADQIDQIKSSLTRTCEAIIGGTRGVLGNSRRRSVDPGSECGLMAVKNNHNDVAKLSWKGKM